MFRNISKYQYFKINSDYEFNNIVACGSLKYDNLRSVDIKRGNYKGPGWYVLLNYSECCSRNCCYKSINELLTKEDFIIEVKEQIKDLAYSLKELRNKN